MNKYDIYFKRLNRYGEDYKDRIQGQREKEFKYYLSHSIYKIEFDYENNIYSGALEPYKKDETLTLQYLLVERTLEIPNGTLLNLDNVYYMIYWKDAHKASGYNRYVVLKMTHHLQWKDQTNIQRDSFAYVFGKKNSSIVDELLSSKKDSLYYEDNNYYHIIMPANQYLRKDDYLTLDEAILTQQFIVKGYDLQTNVGVEYVTIDPIYEYDFSPTPEKTEDDRDEDYYWLNGGTK